MDFSVPADYRMGEKSGENLDNYLDSANEMEKLWITKVMVAPVIVGNLDRFLNSGKRDCRRGLRFRGRTGLYRLQYY